MRRPFAAAAAGAACLVLLAACGGGDGSAPAETEGEDGALTPITVGVLPIVDTAAIYLGVEQGIFAEHGLDVSLELAAGGAAVVPGVVSGDYQFGFSNSISVLLAADQGLPLVAVAAGVASTGDPEADMGAIMAGADSGISSPADLGGATVAVNTLNSIGSVLVSHVAELNGADASTIDFVEMGFPDMPASLANGNVDAAWIFEPFITIAEDQGAQVVSHLLVETDEDLQISIYFTTRAFADGNPETLQAFVSAMEASLDFAEENPDEARAMLASYTQIAPEVQQALTMPRFPSVLDVGSLELLTELSQRYGLISPEFDASSVLP